MNLQPTLTSSDLRVGTSSSTRDLNKEYSILLLETIPTVLRNVRTAMREAAKERFTVPQFRILIQVGLSPKTNAELADWMGVTAPTMSRMLATLERKKLVQRKSNKKDRRQQYLTLTALGKKETEHTKELVRAQFAERLKSHSPAKKETMAQGLHALKQFFL